MDPTDLIKNRPKWMQGFIDMVRPSGVALMFLVITILPLIFALVEIGIEGVGVRMANVLASYFRAVPNVFYDTLQIMFIAYVAGKSGEKITDKIMSNRTGGSVKTEINAKEGDIVVNQPATPSEGPGVVPSPAVVTPTAGVTMNDLLGKK